MNKTTTITQHSDQEPSGPPGTAGVEPVSLRTLSQDATEPCVQRMPESEQIETSSITFKEDSLQGWLVVFGSTVTFFLTVGLIYCFGVLSSELLQRNYASSSTLGWVSSTTVCFMPLLAIPVTTLIRRTSNRSVGLLGALCTGFGYIATSYTFDKSIATLFCAQSLFVRPLPFGSVIFLQHCTGVGLLPVLLVF